MEYIVGDKKFTWSYSELRETYHAFNDMTDEEFLKNIPAILHFACFVCFIKEIPGYICLSDTGIVHELIHILHLGPKGATSNLQDIRTLFKEQLKLA